MFRTSTYIKLLVVVTWILLPIFAGSTSGQSQSMRPDNPTKEVPASESVSDNKNSGVEPRRNDLETEVSTLKAENAVVRELLRKMEEQQKLLIEQVDKLQRRLDGNIATQPAAATSAPTLDTVATNANSSSSSEPQPPIATAQTPDEQPSDGGHYRDGIIIWETKEDAKIPFQLKFTNTTQVRYLNTLSANDTFTDHL